jgi:hypothetical protein
MISAFGFGPASQPGTDAGAPWAEQAVPAAEPEAPALVVGEGELPGGAVIADETGPVPHAETTATRAMRVDRER